ncbi:phage tail tape measure protein [Janthinobacterium sp. EB271-G4-7A]|uniref:phage tail tape measure protein n=1 Tax=Janthinobacterium sp. EB271-G4-7A TaxID=2775056 RepID=UPI001E48EEDB|nr:phage tail protein [Janthinobacterium sp. EB271-G4-7A]MCC7699047.1 phage tail protein [Janthinobacterium sp. EB271-G4-7A]
MNDKLKETKYLRKLQEEFRTTSSELKKSKLALNDTRVAFDNQRLAQHKLASETRAARTEFKGLQLELMRTREPSGKLSASFALARDNLTRLELKYSQSQEKLRSLKTTLGQADAAVTRISGSKLKLAQNLTLVRQKMDAAGTSTSKMRQHERTLATDIAAANTQLEIQQKKLATLKARQDRVATAQQGAAKAKAIAGGVASAGVGATVAGAAIGAPVVKGLHEAKHYEIETARIRALGTRTGQEKEHAIEFAKQLKTYGVSQLEKTEMIRDSISIFADGHHAEMALPTMSKMKFINDTLYPESAGERNAQLFAMQKVIELRGNAGSVEAFKSDADRVQKVIAATGGRVGGEDWRQFTIRSGVAGKGLNDNAFFNQMEPMLQELGGSTAGVGWRSLYNNIYQGKGTQRAAREMQSLGLLSGKHIKYDKVGQIKYIQAGALLEGELFQKSPLDWIEKVFLPKLAAKGITDKDEINSKIGALVSNSNGAAFLMRMVDQRAQIRKSERLNQNSEGMDSLHVRARGLGAGAERETLAKVSDLKLVMGEKILPMYTQGLEMAIAAMTRLNAFMERNPTTAKVMITAFAVLAGLLLVLGPLMLGIAAMIGPYAMLHVMFAKMGVTGGVLTPILRGLGGAFMWAGRAVLWLGRALLMNPIGIAITVIAGAAFLIYKYWEPIKGFFGGLWLDVKAAFAGGFTGINSLIADWSPLGLFYRAFAGVLGWFGVALPARFTDFAADIRGRFAKGLAPLAGFFTGIWSQIKTAFAGGIGGVSALIANWSPLGLFYRAFAGVLGWFGIALPAKFTDFGASILQRITASWQPIAAFFGDIWSRLRTVCAGGMGSITALIINWSPVGVFYQAFAGVLSWFGIKLPAQFTEFGANILRGLVNGITGSMGAVKDAISNAGSSTIAWFKEKLGIHSPSRVFAQLGDYTMQGLAVGLDRSEGAPIAKVSGLAQRLTQLGAGIAIGTATALPASAFDTRAPLPVGGFGAGMTIQGDKIEITFNVQAGTDPQAIARAVSAVLDQRDREKAARIRSSLRDHD